jgi:hypothetical protein
MVPTVGPVRVFNIGFNADDKRTPRLAFPKLLSGLYLIHIVFPVIPGPLVTKKIDSVLSGCMPIRLGPVDLGKSLALREF